MTKNIFKLLLMVMVIVLAFTGCKLIKVDEAMDSQEIVAEYNGGVITKGEAKAEYDDIIQMYENAGYGEALKDKDTIAGIKQDMLDYMVRENITEAKTKELGLDTIPEEKRIEILKTATDEYNQIVDMYTSGIRSEGQSDEDARASTIAYLEQNMGINEEIYKNYALSDFKQTQLFDELTKDVVINDEDIKAAYDNAVEQDKEAFTEDPAGYGTAVLEGDAVYWAPEGYRTVKHILIEIPEDLETELIDLQSNYDDVMLAIEEKTEDHEGHDHDDEEEEDVDYEGDSPDEAVEGQIVGDAEEEGEEVKGVAVTPEEGGVTGSDASAQDETVDEPAIEGATNTDVAEAIASSTNDEDEDALQIEASDGLEVSLVDSQDEEDETFVDYSQHTLEELNVLKEDFEKKIADLQEAIKAELMPKAQEVEDKIKAGEDFQALIDEYGADPGMKTEPTMTTGYYVSEASDNWDPPFKEAAMALAKVGDVSEPIMGANGFHIIRYETDVPYGAVDFESVKDSLTETALEEKKQTVYDETTQAWFDEADVKLYPNKL